MSIAYDVRPWGRYDVLDREEAVFQVKRIAVLPGERLSYQRHQHRAEHWFVISGRGTVTLDGVERGVGPATAVDVAPGVAHRIANAGDDVLVFIEVQTGTYFGEDDIERLADDYGRVEVRAEPPSSISPRRRRAALAATVLRFGVVGATGIVVNSAALWALVSRGHLAVLLGAALATQVSTTWNFVLIDRFVFRREKARPWWQRFLGFAAINNAVLLARLPLLAWLVALLGGRYLLGNVLTLIAAFAVRFVASDHFLFTSRRDMTITARAPRTTPSTPRHIRRRDPSLPLSRTGPTDVAVDLREPFGVVARVRDSVPAWRYDVHGLLSIASVVPLGELESFRTEPCAAPCDIEIRRGDFGNHRARARARVTQYAAAPAVAYEEHLGRLGCDFLVEMGDTIRVTVGPLLVASPHVLYTNVIEALLRFALVARGRVLLHSACLEIDGRGLLLSARTDTGKTGTVLRLLREGRAHFLSDDMTIVSPDGTALAFPKPLTISQHTLRAVDAGELTRAEWRWLTVQSRLHSREGRGVGAWLGEHNLPIMSLNAVTQYLVPPPKYGVHRLVACEDAVAVPLAELFVIERGAHLMEPIAPDVLIDQLIENTDDAYGFPPFRYFAPALEIDGHGYDELRARERALLTEAMRHVRARRLVTPDFSWAPRIADLTREASARADAGDAR
ncbi:MAG: GtrA family protein [Marmoricola sp.]